MNKATQWFLLLTVTILCGACSQGFYGTQRYMNHDLGVTQAARELSKGNFVFVSMHDDAAPVSTNAVLGRKPPEPVRSDITFAQYLTQKYGIRYRVLKDTSYEYLTGYNSVMTAALRERFGDDFYERARKEFYPNAKESDFIRERR